MRLFIFLLLLVFIGCSQPKKAVHPEKLLNMDEIEFVVLTNKLYSSDSSYTLSEEESRMFVEEWNNSKKEGLYKMKTEYFIGILTKSYDDRRFRINGSLIKENGDLAFSLSNSNIIRDLWKKADLTPQAPPLPTILSECDSLAKLANTDYESGIRKHTTFGMVEATEFEQFYSKMLEVQYDIKTRSSCTINFNYECYYNSMNREIEKEYGENFMSDTREKAEIEFNKLNK